MPWESGCVEKREGRQQQGVVVFVTDISTTTKTTKQTIRSETPNGASGTLRHRTEAYAATKLRGRG